MPLSPEDYELIKEIESGKYFVDMRSKYGHCKLCSNQFNNYAFKELSSKYKFWEIGVPTQPYTPFGTMIYLKDRSISHKSSISSLNYDEISELITLIQDIYQLIKKSDFNYDITGINVMFNQFTVSQACLHGHLEIMLKDADKLNIGCVLKDGIDSNLTMKYMPNLGNYNEYGYFYILSKDNQADYKEVINLFNEVRDYKEQTEKIIKCNGINDIDDYLNMFSPTPLANVFFTYYRDKIIYTVIPELYLKPIDFNNINMDEMSLYCLKYNSNAVFDKYRLMYQCSPMIRPCIKLNEVSYDEHEYAISQKRLEKILNNGYKNL